MYKSFQITFEMLGDAAELLKALLKYKQLQKALKLVIKRTVLKQQDYYYDEIALDKKKRKFYKCSYRYFKKNITMSKFCQMLFSTVVKYLQVLSLN